MLGVAGRIKDVVTPLRNGFGALHLSLPICVRFACAFCVRVRCACAYVRVFWGGIAETKAV